MGTFICTHIITSFGKRPEPEDRAEIDRIPISRVDNPELFMVEENEGYYEWKLKPGILGENLYNLLKIFYEDFYGNDQHNFKKNCLPVLDFLKTRPTETEIWNYLKNTISDVFWISECHYLGADTIALSYEGKVCYEEVQRHLDFFNLITRKVYQENPLGGCLIIDID